MHIMGGNAQGVWRGRIGQRGLARASGEQSEREESAP